MSKLEPHRPSLMLPGRSRKNKLYPQFHVSREVAKEVILLGRKEAGSMSALCRQLGTRHQTLANVLLGYRMTLTKVEVRQILDILPAGPRVEEIRASLEHAYPVTGPDRWK